jgi:hypothetical protein
LLARALAFCKKKPKEHMTTGKQTRTWKERRERGKGDEDGYL